MKDKKFNWENLAEALLSRELTEDERLALRKRFTDKLGEFGIHLERAEAYYEDSVQNNIDTIKEQLASLPQPTSEDTTTGNGGVEIVASAEGAGESGGQLAVDVDTLEAQIRR